MWGFERKRLGLTMIELLVVLAIVVVLAALTVSAITRLEAKSNMSSCMVKLKTIGQALKMYRLDEGEYPEWMFAGQASPQVPQNGSGPAFNPDTAFRPGLWALYDMGYLSSARVLLCPENPFEGESNANLMAAQRWGDLFEKLHGYESRDPITGEWKYLPDRSGSWPEVLDSTSIHYNRHLRARYPADTTVVLWCPYHRDTYTRGGIGIDLVLFLDGHVEKREMPRNPADTRAMLFPQEG